jgi:serine/threonine-protein kinase
MAEDRIGPYRLVRRIGSGTMGVVYLAHHEDRPLEPVAVKRVHALSGEQERARLRREASTLARLDHLDHPNIVRVLEVIDDGDDLALVLTYAEGGTLAGRRADHGPLSPDDAVAVLAPVADALADAHRHGVLHRDVKPSNILFTADGRPLLADFGIARNAAHTNLTRTDLAIGTAAYLDPEVADGAEPNPASDIYGLGVVAYEALTGEPPFRATSPLGVLRAADRGDHPPLPASLGPVAAVVTRAMARRPEQRWPSADLFAAALRGEVPPDEGLDDATTTFRRRIGSAVLDDAPPVRRPWRRRVLAALVGVAVVAAVGGVAMGRSRPHRLRTLPVPALPVCSAQTDAQCVARFVRTATGVQVDFASGERAEFRLGRSGDAIRVANFFCGERATAALYRPDDGVVYYLSNWPDPKSDETSEVSVDATGLTGAAASVGDVDDDGCADLALDVAGTRTWFRPADQTGRLERGELVVSSRSAA